MRHLSPWIALLSASILLIALSACDQGTAEKPKQKSRDHLVEAVTVNRISIGVERVRNGTLRARREVQIHNQEDGQIINLPYFEFCIGIPLT